MSKIKIAKALTTATGKPEESYACVQALEEDERERKAEQDRVIAQMRHDELQRKAEQDRVIAQMRHDELQRKAEHDRVIAQMREDNAKFIDIVQRELQLQHKQLDLQNKQLEVQNKQLRFLSWAIPVATGGLALLIIVFNAIN